MLYEVITLHAAKKNLNYLMQFKKKLNDSTSYFLYKNKAKLGAVALPILTMCKLNSICKDTSFTEVSKELANMIRNNFV